MNKVLLDSDRVFTELSYSCRFLHRPLYHGYSETVNSNVSTFKGSSDTTIDDYAKYGGPGVV